MPQLRCRSIAFVSCHCLPVQLDGFLILAVTVLSAEEPLHINDSSSKSGLLVLWLACFVAHQQPQLLSYNTYFATSMTMQLLPSEPVMLAGQDM